MTDVTEEMQQMTALHGAAVLVMDGGLPTVLLPKFSFRGADSPIQMDLLLVPQHHTGYATRLFFEHPVQGRGANWTQHFVAGRTWWAPSWNGVEANQRWTSMLGAHLRAVA